jgi:hypothetical protein
MIVETSSARVLGEGEQRIAGWTLLSPEDRNIKLSPKLEEKVLLLVSLALERQVLANVPEQSRHLRRLVQLYPRKGRWVHAYPSSIRHFDSKRSIYPVSTPRSWSRSPRGKQCGVDVADPRTLASSSTFRLTMSKLATALTRSGIRVPNLPSLPLRPVPLSHRSSMPISTPCLVNITPSKSYLGSSSLEVLLPSMMMILMMRILVKSAIHVEPSLNVPSNESVISVPKSTRWTMTL